MELFAAEKKHVYSGSEEAVNRAIFGYHVAGVGSLILGNKNRLLIGEETEQQCKRNDCLIN